MIWMCKAWEESICVYVITAHNLSGFSLRLDGFWGHIRYVHAFYLSLISPSSHLIKALACQIDFFRETFLFGDCHYFIQKENISLSGNLYAVNTSLFEEAEARFYASNSLTFGTGAVWKDKTLRHLLTLVQQKNTGSFQDIYTHWSSMSGLRCYHYAWLPPGAVFAFCWVVWLFVVRQLAAQLLGLRYGWRGPPGDIISFEQGHVYMSLETHPVFWSSPLTLHQSRHAERHRTSQGPLARAPVYIQCM